MINLKTKKAKLLSVVGIAVLTIGIIFFLLRGPYLSNSIKRIILPVLENATRERIIIDKAVINLFPFYLQAKGFKLFDKDGNRLLWITKTRVYIDVLGLLSKEIRVRKLTIREPKLTASGEDLKRIITNLKESLSAGDDEDYGVILKNIKLTEGKFSYTDAEREIVISGNDLFLDMVSRTGSSVANVVLKQGTIQLPNQSELDGSFNGKIELERDRIKITELNVHSSNSSLTTKGEMFLSPEGEVSGNLETKIKIYTEILNKIFGLKQGKDGFLSYDGSVRLVSDEDSKGPQFVFHGKTDGQFYLETLMEILGVDETIQGKLSFNGKISGTYPEVRGRGTVNLENALFDTLALDDVAGEITYNNNMFSLDNFIAHTYKGKLMGDAHISIPEGDYTVVASVTDVSSPEFFKFIEWEPPFPEGRISGNFQLNQKHDRDIEVRAKINYKNNSAVSGNVIDRLTSVRADLELRNDILNLNNSILSTARSDLMLTGTIDLDRDFLDLKLFLESRDVSDVTAPYYTALTAPARFKGKATGKADDPAISGRLEVDAGSIHGIRFENAASELTYRIRTLTVDRLHVNQGKGALDVSGTIDFRKAKELFSFEDPQYNAKASMKNINMRPFITSLYGEVPLSGRVNGQLQFKGDSGDFEGRGDLVVRDVSSYGHQFDSIAVKAALRPEHIEFQSVTADKGDSRVTARGTVFFDKRFTVSAASDRIRLRDFPGFDEYAIDALFSLDLNGNGTLDNPDLNFSAKIKEGFLKDVHLGKGDIRGVFKDKKLTAAGNLMDGLVHADAGVVFSDKILWNVDAAFKKGRYEHFIANGFRGIPEDFTASLEGDVTVKGEGRTFSLNSKLSSVALSLYGYDLGNNEDIVFDIIDDELRIHSFSLTGKHAGLTASGTIKINSDYDLTLSGYLNTAPIGELSDDIASLRGRCDFAVGIAGAWNKPKAVGEISINNASAAIKQYPYKIGPVNGTVFFRKDRITFRSLKVKIAGGEATMSGAGYFDGLTLAKVFISADMRDLKIRPVDGLSTAFGGKLFYEKSVKGASLTGNLNVKKARYTKNIDWKRWLLGLKEMNDDQVQYPEFVGETELNIRIAGSENIIIDNNLARTPVRLALNVTGTVADVGLLGRIEAREGTVYFRGNEFNILEGSSVDFVEPLGISPVFHMLADSYVTDYYVKLSLDGTVDNFTLSLFSDPPLPEADILTLLTFGQVRKDAKGFDSGIAAGEAAAILTGDIQEEFKYITGFERFEIGPDTTKEGSLVPRVSVGKRLLEDKLFVIYSTAIGTTEESIVKLEYKLTRDISIVGSRNEIGSVGADLKYKFEFK